MSSIRASFALRRSFLSAAPSRSFQTSRILAAGKESALGNENRAEEAEAAKQKQLKKQKEGKGEWHEELASDSESIVKADRGDIDASADTIKKLQEESAKVASKKE
ncbi:hypothetical protein M8818_000945 [Zalaria obscura]|uniref:Uncharacterized protein n=1 Tax=Zalaria obscura TaxID=2024903 RepID=A0ACC3SLM8_9PEZI